MMWRSRYSRTNNDSSSAESGMGEFFLGDERQNLLAMIEEVAQRVEDLRLGYAKCLGNLQDRFPLSMQRGDVPNGHAQPVDHRLAPTDIRQALDMRMLCLDRFGHASTSKSAERISEYTRQVDE